MDYDMISIREKIGEILCEYGANDKRIYVKGVLHAS